MNCIVDILDTFLPGATEGGQWELVGFSLTSSGTFSSGGNWPWSTNANDHVIVDFKDIVQGFYKLNYFQVGQCGGLQEIIIPVVGGGDAGITKSITLCTSDNAVNIFDELGAIYDTGVLQAEFEYLGSGTTSPGYSPNNANNPSDDIFDPSLATPGSYQITLNIDPEAPNSYILNNCDECLPTTASLFITVIQSSIEIGINNCEIVLLNSSGCISGSYELYKDTGSGFQPTGITSLPFTTNENADWKIIYNGCDCANSTIESNIVTSVDCCINPITIAETSSCTLEMTSSGCQVSGLTEYEWYRSTDNGITWTLFSTSLFTSILQVTDDACYRLEIANCTNGCIARSNIICVNCSGQNCPQTFQVNKLSCALELVSVPCTGAVALFQKLVNGSWTTQSTYSGSTFPHTFSVDEDGTYRILLQCPGCPDIEGAAYAFTGCTPCTSVVSLSLSGCTLTATVTNCPNPTYIFRRNGVIVQNSTLNTYIVSQDGNYTVQVTGCPGCNILNSNSISVTGCAPACTSSLNIQVNNCTILANVTNCPNPTYIFRRNGVIVQSGPLSSYTTSVDGLFTVEATGCPNCPPLTSSPINISGCNPTCNSTVNLTANNCILTAIVTNCPSPIFVFMEGSNILQSGPSNTYTVVNNGTYTVEVIGCPNCPTLTDSVVVSNCSVPCNSVLTANANGCTVTANVTNCPNPTYTFVINGNTVQSGPSNTYTHSTNQNVTVNIFVSGCPNCGTLSTSAFIQCSLCQCSTSIFENNCVLFATDSNCTGYTAVWRWFDSSNNTWITKGTGTSITPDENGLWERRLTKSGCPPVISQITINCLSSNCTLEIDQFEVDPQDCSRVLFAYSGASGSNVTIQFSYPQVNVTDCGSAGGWTAFNPTGSWSTNTNGSGGGFFNVPSQHFNKCLRIIVSDDGNPNCTIKVAYVFVGSCCNNSTLNINAGGPSVYCQGSGTNILLTSSTSGGVSPYTYEWRDPNGSVIGNSQNQVLLNPIAGTYTVEVTDAQGCIDTDTHQLSINNMSLNIQILDSTPYCQNETIQLQVTGFSTGSTFNWVTDGQIVSGQGTSILSVNWPTTGNKIVTVQVTDSDGCTFEETQNVNIVNCCGNITAQISTSNIEWCEGDGAITLNATFSGNNGNVITSWKNPNGTVIGNSTSISFTPNSGPNYPPGTYTFEVIDTLGCQAMDTVQVTVFNEPNITINATPNPQCINEPVDLSLTGMPSGATANWSTPGGNQQFNGSNLQVMYATEGTKTITVTVNQGSCQWQFSTQIEINNCCATPQFSINCINPKIDYIFLIDTSGSISSQEWNDMKDSIDATIDELELNSQDKRYAIVQYGSNSTSNNIEVSVSFTSNATTAKTYTRASLGSADHLNPTIGLIINEFSGGQLNLRPDANRKLIFFTDANNGTGNGPGGGSNIFPQTNMNILKGTWNFQVSAVWYYSGTTNIPDYASIASVGGNYNGPVTANSGDPEGSGTTPRRLYIRTTFDGLPVPGLSEDVNQCELSLTNVPANSTYLWSTGDNSPSILIDQYDNQLYTVTITSGNCSWTLTFNNCTNCY